MAKSKSSASSATRKKYAKKAAAASGQFEEPTIPKEKKAKGKEKKSKEPRKVYIPPVKPTPVQPDPLDTLGLAQTLPPELLVVLRRLAKKDSITKRRALEELQIAWVDKARNEGADSPLLTVLADTLPVWLHHVPQLFLHPSRRIRLLAVSLHTSLLRLPTVRDQLFSHIREVASADHAEYLLGVWCMVVHDVDRQVCTFARESWNKYVTLADASGAKLVLDPDLLQHVWEFIHRTILNPSGMYLYVNPPQPVAASPVPQRKGPGRPVPVRRDEESSTRAKTEEEQEEEQDRKARLRVGAFGSAEWVINAYTELQEVYMPDEFLKPFSNPALWSSLYHARMPPFVQVESFGFNQPGLRSSAWSLLQTLLRTCKGHLKTLLPVLSTAVLRSAWVEPDANVRGTMWQPLLTFLRGFPQVWEMEALSEKDADDGEDSDSEDDEDDERPTKTRTPTRGGLSTASSAAYREFLQFLELGCLGSPIQGYPAVLIILSTIPSSVLATSSTNPLHDLFTSFWAAIDGRALSSLDRTAASAAFLSALLECLVFVIRRVIHSRPEEASLLMFGAISNTIDLGARSEAVRKLTAGQFARVWEELSSQHLKIEGVTAGQLMVRTLTSLYQLDVELFGAAWEALASGMKYQLDTEDADISPLVPTVLKLFQDRFETESGPGVAAKALIREVVQLVIQQCENILNNEEAPASEHLSSLARILDAIGETLFADSELAERIDETIRHHMYRLLSTSPALLLVYLSRRQNEAICLQSWQGVLFTIAAHPEDASPILIPLLNAAEQGQLPDYLEPRTETLDNLADDLLVEALAEPSSSIKSTLIRKILYNPGYFVSQDCFQRLVASLSSAFTLHCENVLRDGEAGLDAFDVFLELINALFEHQRLLQLPEEVLLSLLSNIFLLAHLLPKFRLVDAPQLHPAQRLWEAWVAQAPKDMKDKTCVLIKQRLRDLLADCSTQPTPEQILQTVAEPCPGLDIDLMVDIFPSRDELDAMLDGLPSSPFDTSLAVVDPLVPPASFYESQHLSDQVYDSSGYSMYARIVDALLLHLVQDRHSAKEHIWALRHIIALSLYANDSLQSPTSPSPVFANQASGTTLQEITIRAQQITAYLLSSTQEEGWHGNLVAAMLANKADDSLDGIGRLVSSLINHGKRQDTVRESRILHLILQHAINNSSKEEAEGWMTIARKLEKPAPQTSLAILLSITRYAPNPPLLDLYRNELAAGMLGIPARKANTDGLWLLRKLAVTAPNPESDVIFLPQPRAVNLMKACQQWITSDEELDEDVESEMTLVFLHLAPILQSVPGTHWGLIFDVMENNLENSSFSDRSTLVALGRSLQLFITVQDLASTNKSLHAVWQERQATCLVLIRELAAQNLDRTQESAPLSVCRELALQIVQDLPEELVDEGVLSKMCHVVMDSSVDVQRMAYQLLHKAAMKYTEHLVIEAAVDSEATVRPRLPLELVDILQRSLNHENDTEQDCQDLSGYLISWMITFDLFTNASLKVKSGYIDHMRELEVVAMQFLPTIINVLGLYGGIPKAFKLDIWGVDEYYIDTYPSDTFLSIQLLAAHLYYRALLVIPSLIRDWLADCRDRQLFNAFTTYTSIHFSPAIIRTQLAQVKNPDAAADLVDEIWTIKVANTVNEVTASYAVDEHHLEITVKLPSDYPLHGIEIRDPKWVGVSDERWRAWILGVQQILSYRSGSIIDGLSFFKKNVTSHFEGLGECAICYSTISAMDSSLPRKPCKTCKNPFHAGCLYKWFNTSHSSSCPMCRSEISWHCKAPMYQT
ncbi:hypothetical protein AcV7_001681 [Taiwanofungus camphoratus]|nr:hypothetical protein AcV7_001681 [Antrodia cinnamomea]